MAQKAIEKIRKKIIGDIYPSSLKLDSSGINLVVRTWLIELNFRQSSPIIGVRKSNLGILSLKDNNDIHFSMIFDRGFNFNG